MDPRKLDEEADGMRRVLRESRPSVATARLYAAEIISQAGDVLANFETPEAARAIRNAVSVHREYMAYLRAFSDPSFGELFAAAQEVVRDIEAGDLSKDGAERLAAAVTNCMVLK